MKRVAIVAASALMGAAFLFAASVSTSYAAKVDCSKVMDELSSGKSAKDVAKDLGISTSSVYRCKRHAKEEAKAGTKTMNKIRGEAVGSPAAMPSTAAPAAPPATH